LLDWGRKNIEYLKVRKDLPDWPTPGKVDGSAHFLGDHGLVVLFNSDKQSLEGQFVLTEESVGLKKKGAFLVTQQYPLSDRQTKAGYGAVVRWPVPPETALILRIQPAE